MSYGGSHGFTEAIHLASPVLGNVKFVEEKELIARYFEEVSYAGYSVWNIDIIGCARHSHNNLDWCVGLGLAGHRQDLLWSS